MNGEIFLCRNGIYGDDDFTMDDYRHDDDSSTRSTTTEEDDEDEEYYDRRSVSRSRRHSSRSRSRSHLRHRRRQQHPREEYRRSGTSRSRRRREEEEEKEEPQYDDDDDSTAASSSVYAGVLSFDEEDGDGRIVEADKENKGRGGKSNKKGNGQRDVVEEDAPSVTTGEDEATETERYDDDDDEEEEELVDDKLDYGGGGAAAADAVDDLVAGIVPPPGPGSDLVDIIEQVFTGTGAGGEETDTTGEGATSGASNNSEEKNNNNKDAGADATTPAGAGAGASPEEIRERKTKAILSNLDKLCYRLATNDSSLTVLLVEDLDQLTSEDEGRAAAAIEDALPQSRYVTGVKIQNVRLTRRVACCLGRAVGRSKSVLHVCLSNCAFGSGAAAAAGGGGAGGDDEAAGFACFMMGVQHNPKIEEFSVVSCRLSGLNADVVSAAAPLMKLGTLALIDADVGADAGRLQFLCDNIERSPELTYLNLSRNPKLGGGGGNRRSGRSSRGGTKQPRAMKLITDSLLKQKNVTRLDFSACGLDDDSIKHLVKGLLSNPVVSSLNLSNNDLLTNKSALYLKHLLKHNNKIKQLQVDGCPDISLKRLKAIEDGLRYNNSFLQRLGFAQSTSLAILESLDLIENLGSPSHAATAAAVVSP